MEHIKAPNCYSRFLPDDINMDIFLGGSIEMGVAEPWQDRLVERFNDSKIRFVNPRRDNWDSSWVQSISDPNFSGQVNWELSGLDRCDLIVFYFDPNTKSPTTLMELGLYATSEKVIVCCPDGFWRKGNVEIVCNRYNIPLTATFEELVEAVEEQYALFC